MDYTVNNHVLDTGIFTLGVFSDQHRVNVVVGRFVAGDGFTGTDVGKEVKCSAESEVQGDVTFSNGSLVACQQSFVATSGGLFIPLMAPSMQRNSFSHCRSPRRV